MRGSHGIALAFFLVAFLVWAGVMTWTVREARLAPDASGTVMVAFPFNWADEHAFSAIVAAGGRPVRKTWLGFVWIADAPQPGFVGRLEQVGALGSFSDVPLAPGLGGCAATPSVEKLFRQAGLVD